ncbi:flagellar biosynthesis protein FlhB [Pantoea dispersa]|uniref:flagellar biosynthesis protein FlhB n=1 Tax=Pantoea dispersa TaxID=59814 RepID=UPI0021F6A997|nr:flagellar biosynthesis protein FlhB [Pantoea dispersa]UYP74979.1 flagellar biosynthesis protein FlhB [Pantoea dispersa]
MADESDVEKTEDPTPQRLAKAREEGQIPRSRELTSVLLLLVGWGLLLLGGERLAHQLLALLQQGLQIERASAFDPQQMLLQAGALLKLALLAMLPLAAGLLLTALCAPALLGGVTLSAKVIRLDVTRLSPLKGLKRMLSAQTLSELLKGVLKVTLAAVACGVFLLANKNAFIHLLWQPLVSGVHDGLRLLSRCLLLVVLAALPMVGYDIFWQLVSHLKKLRMSRQEIRDEFKQSEGDPHVKGRIRQIQRNAARSRMMADVPKADVIVNNPTHYSVALAYSEDKMAAPVVLAKGAGEIALRIREAASAHAIPMLEAPPLARALYRHCEIGEAIPASLYTAVAEVLAWVYSLRRWRKGYGLAPQTPANLPVPAALDFARENPE